MFFFVSFIIINEATSVRGSIETCSATRFFIISLYLSLVMFTNWMPEHILFKQNFISKKNTFIQHKKAGILTYFITIICTDTKVLGNFVGISSLISNKCVLCSQKAGVVLVFEIFECFGVLTYCIEWLFNAQFVLRVGALTWMALIRG